MHIILQVKDLMDSNEKVCSQLGDEIKIQKESKLNIIENREIKIDDLYKECKAISRNLQNSNSEIELLISRKKLMEDEIKILQEDNELQLIEMTKLTDDNKTKIFNISALETELSMLEDLYKDTSSKLECEISENNQHKITIETINKRLALNKILFGKNVASESSLRDEMNSKILQIQISHDIILEELRITHKMGIETNDRDFDTITKKLENSYNIISNLENNIIQKEEEMKIMISENASLISNLSADDDKYYNEHLDQLKLIELKNNDKIEALKISYDEEIKSVKNDLFNMEEGLICIILYYFFIN